MTLHEMTLGSTNISHCSCLFSPTCYVVNASSFLGPLHFVKPVYGYVMPVMVLLTSICNLIIILVLSRYSLQVSSSKRKLTQSSFRDLQIFHNENVQNLLSLSYCVLNQLCLSSHIVSYLEHILRVLSMQNQSNENTILSNRYLMVQAMEKLRE